MNLPIRARMTLWFTALLTVILVGGAAFILIDLRAAQTRALDTTLRTSAGEIAADYQPSSGNSESEFRDATDVSLAGLPRDASAAQLVSSDGAIVVSAGNALAATPMLPSTASADARAGTTSIRTVVLGGQDYRVYARPFTDQGQSVALVVATSLENVETSIHRLLLVLAVWIPLGVAAAALGGWFLAKRALRPVATMTDEARAIDSSRLSDRVEIPPAMDEVGRLAVTLNEMLDRIESGVEQQRTFVSNASHELRTPLAIMRAEIDVSLVADDLSEESRQVLESAREETDRMRGIVENLLLLAEMDEGAIPLARDPVELDQLAAEVLEAMKPLAEIREIRLELAAAGSVRVTGDADRLRQVVRNLVDNAIKYAPNGSHALVDVHGIDAGGELIVTNAGPSIPTSSLPHVFDRFYRTDAARGREAGGSGLGLAIVRELVEAQGGRAWVRSADRETAFGFRLPLADAGPTPVGRTSTSSDRTPL
jgi:heavy metal sensor kinase